MAKQPTHRSRRATGTLTRAELMALTAARRERGMARREQRRAADRRRLGLMLVAFA